MSNRRYKNIQYINISDLIAVGTAVYKAKEKR